MAESDKSETISPYFQELVDAHKRIVDELVEDGESGDVKYKQAKDYINSQLKFVPNNRYARADDLDMFMGLVRRAINQINREQDEIKVIHNDGKEN